ncbi:MAG TPA: iron/manganese transporter, partial [Sphingobacterium sp.]|nr:iron/manganese transporter [Sphingobacterium sp.]
TVMPHNLYLHSALVQTRKFNRDDASIKKAIKLNFWDSAIALNMALLVNAAILILAATVFYKTGRSDVAELKQAYELLPQNLGSDFTAKLFAVALIAAGQSSTITGTLAGQIVMEGYLRFRMNPLLRRLITRLLAIVPAALVILINGEGNVDSLLIFSQVVLSMQLGFAVIPLIHFVSDKKTMGKFAIKPVIKIAAWVITIVLVYLNSKLLVEEAITFFATSGNIVWKGLIILSGIGFIILLAYTTLYPLFSRKAFCEITPHDKPEPLLLKSYASFNKIAITVDFKQLDRKVINYAITQGGKDCTYTLIHIVESVASASHFQDSTDEETIKDREFLDEYVKQLQQQGYHAEAKLGFGKAADSIGETVNKSGAELIVMGAHGHKGLKDLLYGATINQVRHLVKVPVLVIPAV